MTNFPQLDAAQAQSEWNSLVEILRDMRELRTGLTQGCERVVKLRWLLAQTENPLFLPFVGVDSELHVFPTGTTRDRWAADALAREDLKRTRVEEHYKLMIFTAIDDLLPYAEERLQSLIDSDTNLKWQSVLSIADEDVARQLADLLSAEAVPAQVLSSSSAIGESPRWLILVPAGMYEGARLLLEKSHYTDAELTYLATGALPGEDELI